MMVDIRDTVPLFRMPDIQVIHIIGQFLDAFLFIYLIQNFFEPKKKVPFKKAACSSGKSVRSSFVSDRSDYE